MMVVSWQGFCSGWNNFSRLSNIDGTRYCAIQHQRHRAVICDGYVHVCAKDPPLNRHAGLRKPVRERIDEAISERAVILYQGRVVEMGATEKIYSNPLHPYTRMLMASVPRLDAKWEDVEQHLEAGGQQPRAVHGCIYAERCPYADGRCAEMEPPLVEVAPDHFVACCQVERNDRLRANVAMEAPVSEES